MKRRPKAGYKWEDGYGLWINGAKSGLCKHCGDRWGNHSSIACSYPKTNSWWESDNPNDAPNPYLEDVEEKNELGEISL